MPAQLKIGDSVTTRLTVEHALYGIIPVGTQGRVVGVLQRNTVEINVNGATVWLRAGFVEPVCEFCHARLADAGGLCCDCHTFGMGHDAR